MFIAIGRTWMMIPCLAALAADPAQAVEPEAKKPAAEIPSEAKPTRAKPSEAKSKEPSNKKKEEKPDPFVVPEGTPEELIEFIDKVRKTPLKNPRQFARAREALIRAAEHVIAAQPEEKTALKAIQIKMQLLGGREKLDGFADELAEDGHEKYARMVRRAGLRLDMARCERREPRNRKKTIAAVLRFLEKHSPPEAADAPLAEKAGQLAELTGDNKFASETYRAAAESFAGVKDEKLAKFAQTLGGVSRRLALPGKEISIQGGLLDGGEFDWSKYDGKVVLVNFWATWSGSSVADLRKLEKYYRRYHDKGFDIVGISCDSRPADLKQFVAERKIPWAIVYGEEEPSPTVAHYGITDIPTNVLIGRHGKVIMLDARGLKLKNKLLEIFGPAEDQ